MVTTGSAAAEELEASFTREVGRIRSASAGPTVILIGGIHGNEPGGVRAAQRVLGRLDRDDANLRGEIIALAGNVGALRSRRRYLAKDLNRQWSDERILEVRRKRDPDPEDREQLELLSAIEDALARARGDVYVLDLHTTSASGIPFAIFGDTMRQRAFGFAFPLPIVLGLEEQLDGVLSGYTTQRGCISLAIEGGQHDDPASIDNLEACIWIALVSAGLIDEVPEHRASYRLLDERRGALPRVMEVTQRHAIVPEDEFRMTPGFANLDRARKGQVLASDRKGEIRAPKDVLVILPLYQGLGSDGFFWGREVSERHLALASSLRKLRIDRLLRFLPGIRRDPERSDGLRANAIAARVYPRDVFHMLGYRRIRSADRGELTLGRHSE